MTLLVIEVRFRPHFLGFSTSSAEAVRRYGILLLSAQPGHNITRLTHIALELSAKRLESLKLALPGIGRVGLLMDGHHPAAIRRSTNEHQAAAALLFWPEHPSN
jgi:hypothetical protein